MISANRAASRGGTFLVVRHPTHDSHGLDVVYQWVRANVPELLPDFDLRMLSDELPQRDDYQLCIPWLQDPIQAWSVRAYQQARRLTEWCDRRSIPVVNRPDRLTDAGKAKAAEMIRAAGIKAPRTVLISKTKELRTRERGVPLPLFIREDWQHGGPMILAATREELERIDLGAFQRPVAVEFIDASRDGLFRKYRYVAAGDHGVSHHLQISREWVTRGSNRVATPQTREEDLEYVSAPDPHHALFQRVRRLLGLDMIAIDYGYDARNEPVIWEVNPYPFIRFSSRNLVYRNFALHETMRAIVMMYYERARQPVPQSLRALQHFKVPLSWLSRWHRFRESLGGIRRSFETGRLRHGAVPGGPSTG